MKDCIFCKIIKGEVLVPKIYEDDKCIVIPDKFPGTKGQSLVISKKHKDYIFDLPDNVYKDLFRIAKKIAKAIDKALKPKRTGIVVEGLAVPHVHVRLHPIYGKGMIMNGEEATKKEQEKIATKIKSLL